MIGKLLRAACCVSAAAIAACSGFHDDASQHTHRCQLTATGGNWAQANLRLFHTDERQCPLAPLIGEVVSTGGVIEDMDATTTSENAASVEITVANTNSGCETFGGNVGHSISTFSWVDWDFDDVPDWASYPSQSYHARTGEDNTHDCVFFLVYMRTANIATAHVTLHYFGEQW